MINLKYTVPVISAHTLISHAEKTGDYKYTPYAGARGKDTFTYRVVDEFGNYSSEATVNMKIEKLKTTLVFSDI